MLLNLHKRDWADGLTVQKFDDHSKNNEKIVKVPAPTPPFCDDVA